MDREIFVFMAGLYIWWARHDEKKKKFFCKLWFSNGTSFIRGLQKKVSKCDMRTLILSYTNDWDRMSLDIMHETTACKSQLCLSSTLLGRVAPYKYGLSKVLSSWRRLAFAFWALIGMLWGRSSAMVGVPTMGPCDTVQDRTIPWVNPPEIGITWILEHQ